MDHVMHLLSFCCIVYEMSAINFYLDEVKSDFLSKNCFSKSDYNFDEVSKNSYSRPFKINIMTS